MAKKIVASAVNARGDKFRVVEGAEGWGYFVEACESSKGLKRFYKVSRKDTIEEATERMHEVMKMGGAV